MSTGVSGQYYKDSALVRKAVAIATSKMPDGAKKSEINRLMSWQAVMAKSTHNRSRILSHAHDVIEKKVDSKYLPTRGITYR